MESSQILLLDERQHPDQALVTLLSGQGYHLQHCQHIDALFAKLQQESVAVVWVYQTLSHDLVLQCCARISEIAPSTQVVLHTDLLSSQALFRCSKVGVFAFLPLSSSQQELSQTLQEATQEHQTKQTTSLDRIYTTLASTKESERMIEALLSTIQEQLAADDIALLLPDDDGHFYMSHALGLSLDEQLALRDALEESLQTQIPKMGVLLEQTSLSHPIRETLAICRILLPLSLGDRLLGVLTLHRSDTRHPFGRDDLQRCAALGTTLCLSIENIRLIRQLVLAERSVSLGQISRNLLQEIRNPLTYVLAGISFTRKGLKLWSMLDGFFFEEASTALLQDYWKNTLRYSSVGDLQQATEDINEGAERIRQILGDMQTFSLIDTDLQESFLVDDSICSAMRLARSELANSIEIVEDLHANIRVFGSAGDLIQVVVNLLFSAGHAIRSQPSLLGKISISSRYENEYIVIEVADNGPYVPPKQIGSLFDAPIDRRNTSSRASLGLTMSREIVRRHGGGIRVRSIPNDKTIFTVVIPANQSSSFSLTEVNPAHKPLQDRRARLLFVDDDSLMLRSYERHFAKEYDLKLCEGGRAARSVLEHDSSFDIIVCEIQMHDVSGIDLYHYLQQKNPTLTQHFVFVTSSKTQREALDFVKSTNAYLLEKPYEFKSIEILVERIRQEQARQ